MPSRMAYSPATRLFRRLAAVEAVEERSHRRPEILAQRKISRRDLGAVRSGERVAQEIHQQT